MPYEIKKKSDGSYEVKNKKTGHISAKHTSKTRAEAQVRLLNMIDMKKSHK